MKYLITGAAGFIGFHLSKRLSKEDVEIVGIDNLNSYYDVTLKESRLNQLRGRSNFDFIRLDMAEKDVLEKLFEQEKFDAVINLAAQPGVRYSITNPDVSIRSNITAFFNLLECCKKFEIKSLIYASSSSVYGNNDKVPSSVTDNVDHPISLYAATKKANELMAYTYHHLYNITTTGLRFFTVYGSWGRPDMAYYKFAKNIMDGKQIDVYNNGDMERDFTYIDDVIESIYRLTKKKVDNKYRLFNIGGEHPVKLLTFIEILERSLGKKAEVIFKEMQPGDVKKTFADSSALAEFIDYKPLTRIEEGLDNFVKWFKDYYNYK
ncbi:MAG TPA: NAD-dependent epimerase/dehydratase family protein [Ignavibacteria bacterium]|nr:NAD-dependent epimerase/dehydratase family protein [Ignavibacteria bacterium]